MTATTADYDQTEDFDSIAPKIGLDYRLNDDIMVYGHVSQGFKSGGFNVRAQSTAFPDSALPFDDEELTNYEFGMKGSFLDGQATLNTAFDRYEFDTAAAILITIIGIVMFAEYSSGLIRARVQ